MGQPALIAIEEIFAPLVVTAAQQAHEMTASVEAEGSWRTGEFHPGFFGRPITFSIVAAMAAGH